MSITTEPTELRDYFAANAPTEIPDWFKPSIPDHLQEPPRPVEAAHLPINGRVPQSVLDWNVKAVALKAQREEFHYFAWRWHYAAQMMEARKAGIEARAQQRAARPLNTGLFKG